MMLTQRVAHERLARICHVDYDREMAFVIEGPDPKSGERVIMVAGRLGRLHGVNDAGFSLLVNDQFQGQGLGKKYLNELLQIAKAEKVKRVIAYMSVDNLPLQKICEDLGFRLIRAPGAPIVHAEIEF